jgi:glycosyltransferase involved in cell wall biosynthesis
VQPHFRPVVQPAHLDQVRARYGLPERFILIVCTIEPRKNHGLLLETFGRIVERQPDVRLVIAGKPGWLYQAFFDRLDGSGLRDRVILTGHVPERDLPTLLTLATVFAFPSLYEGMGLPPLEAMACGTPVVASNTSSLPEAVGEAGLLLPPDDPRAWAEALERVLVDADLRAELRARGLARAAHFTWEAAAQATLAVYAQAAQFHLEGSRAGPPAGPERVGRGGAVNARASEDQAVQPRAWRPAALGAVRGGM